MKTYAYCRVSTVDQHTEVQEHAIKAKYPDAVVLTEKVSATSRDGRGQLELLMQVVSKGDKIVVWKLDRLARNMRDLSNIVGDLEAKGVALEILDQAIDTSTASGKAFLQMLGVFAEFETNLRKERQMAGIAKAKAEGRYKGRPEKVNADELRALLSSGVSKAEAARRLGVSYRTVIRRSASAA